MSILYTVFVVLVQCFSISVERSHLRGSFHIPYMKVNI
jgi:hypothetical protein